MQKELSTLKRLKYLEDTKELRELKKKERELATALNNKQKALSKLENAEKGTFEKAKEKKIRDAEIESISKDIREINKQIMELKRNSNRLNNLYEQEKIALQELENAKKGIFKDKKQTTLSVIEKEVSDNIKSIRKEISKLEDIANKEGLKTLIAKRDKAMETLENAKKGIFTKKEKVEKEYTEAEKEVVNEIDEALKQIRDFRKGYNYDEKANKILKALETNDFSAFEPRTRQGLLNQSVIEKKIRLNVLMKEMAQQKAKKEMSKWEFYVRDVLQIPQFLQTTLDFPPIMGRQGVIQF